MAMIGWRQNWNYMGAGLRRMSVLGMSLVFLLAAASPVRAGSPVIDAEQAALDDLQAGAFSLEPCDEQTRLRLEDGLLEYDEIPLRIHYYNTNIRQNWEDLDKTYQKLQRGIEELRSGRRKAEREKDSAKKHGDIENQIGMAVQEKMINGAIDQMGTSARRLYRQGNLSSLRRGEDQLTMQAQSLMLSYDTTRKQMEIMNRLHQVYIRQYQIVQRKQALGMVTDTEMQDAAQNLLSCESSLLSMESVLAGLRRDLCSIVGWKSAQPLEIGEIPPVDLSQYPERDLAEDTRLAVGNNQQLMELRRSEKGKTSAGIQARKALIEEQERAMEVKLRHLYDAVDSSYASHQAASTGYQAALHQKSALERRYQMDMISEAEFLEGMVAFYQKEAEWKLADVNLRMAAETYGWAVKGLVSLE